MIRYNDAGLRNVWLANGYREQRTAYGKGLVIDDVEGLARAVCGALTRKHGRLTGSEFRYVRLGLRLSQKNLARLLGNSEQTVALWEKRGNVPVWADRNLRMLWIAKLDGNAAIGQVMERLNTVERLLGEQIIVEEGRRGWKSRVEAAAVQAIDTGAG